MFTAVVESKNEKLKQETPSTNDVSGYSEMGSPMEQAATLLLSPLA